MPRDARRASRGASKPRTSPRERTTRSSRACASCSPTTWAARLRSTRPAGSARRSAARTHFPEARGPGTHGRAQDQQRARSGAARAAHGQAAHHRRDRRRPARRRDGDGLRAARAATATSTWAPRTWSGRRSTSFACELLGATCRRVDAGSKTLKDAINEAMRDWVAERLRQLLPARVGARSASVSADGPGVSVGHRPGSARADASSSIGRLPDTIVACVGGGSNAMGIFDAFIDDRATCG